MATQHNYHYPFHLEHTFALHSTSSNPSASLQHLLSPQTIARTEMSGWMGSLFGSRRSTQESARDAIVGLRQQLLMLEKKEDFLQTKIEDETKKARANATSNKRCKLSAHGFREFASRKGKEGKGWQAGRVLWSLRE